MSPNLLRPGRQLLLPARPLFIWISLIIALVLDLLPFGRILWMPDFLAVVLVFWSIHQPRRVGLTIAFIAGLCLDVQQATLLGQHALAFTALIYFAIMVHRRILWFSVLWQTLQLFPLFLAAHLIVIGLRMLGGAAFPGWPIFLAPVFESLLWPIATAILLMPQRRAPDPDQDRPL